MFLTFLLVWLNWVVFLRDDLLAVFICILEVHEFWPGLWDLVETGSLISPQGSCALLGPLREIGGWPGGKEPWEGSRAGPACLAQS